MAGALAEGRSINTGFYYPEAKGRCTFVRPEPDVTETGPELQNHSSPGHAEPGEGQGIIFPANTYYAFHPYSEPKDFIPYSEPKDFTPTRSILANKTGPSAGIQHSGGYLASAMQSAKEKNNSDLLQRGTHPP